MKSRLKDNPRLEERVNQNGYISLYLEFYLGRISEKLFDENGQPVLYESGKMKGTQKYKVRHIRKREGLNLHLYTNPKTAREKQYNKDTLLLAKRIRAEREQEFLKDREGYRLNFYKNIDFIEFYTNYLQSYTKRDKKSVKQGLTRFTDFLRDTPRYNRFIGGIKINQIDREMIFAFTEYLQSRSRGTGAKSIYARFKKVFKYAIDNDIISKDPTQGISIKADLNRISKEILSIDEINKLSKTPYHKKEIQRAFLFCCYTGVRFCDVVALTFKNIDRANNLLKFEQNKTKGRSANSVVIIPINAVILKLIGEPKDEDLNSLIFNLPNHYNCVKHLKQWVYKAGINKNVSWHCARHSFAVNMLTNVEGVNLKTISKLMGHSKIEMTEKYIKVADDLKRKAIEGLPMFDIE